MVEMVYLIRKLHTLILYLIKLIRQVLCCFSSRQKISTLDNESEELTQIGIIPNRTLDAEWSNSWGETQEKRNEPKTISDHIAQYRDNKMKTQEPDDGEKALQSIFQELEPTNIKQKRVLIGKSNNDNCIEESQNNMSRLSADNFTKDLGEWIEEASTGWDEQVVDATEIIRQQKRMLRGAKSNRLADKITN